jgi:hypothetical protein
LHFLYSEPALVDPDVVQSSRPPFSLRLVDSVYVAACLGASLVTEVVFLCVSMLRVGVAALYEGSHADRTSNNAFAQKVRFPYLMENQRAQGPHLSCRVPHLSCLCSVPCHRFHHPDAQFLAATVKDV